MNHMLARWRRLTPIQSSVFAQRFAARPCVPRVTLCRRLLSLSPALCRRLLYGLCSCRLLCACSYRGMRMTFHKAFTKNILHKKKAAMRRPCIGYLQFERACFIWPQCCGFNTYTFKRIAYSLLSYAQTFGNRCHTHALQTIMENGLLLVF